MQITASLIKSLVFAVAVTTLSTAAPTSFLQELDARSPIQAFRSIFRRPECTEDYARDHRSVRTLHGNALFWSNPDPPGWGPTSGDRLAFTQAHHKMQLHPDVWSEGFINEFSTACSGTGIGIWTLLSQVFASMATGDVWFLGDDDLTDPYWATERATLMGNPAVTSITCFDRSGRPTHYIKAPPPPPQNPYATYAA